MVLNLALLLHIFSIFGLHKLSWDNFLAHCQNIDWHAVEWVILTYDFQCLKPKKFDLQILNIEMT